MASFPLSTVVGGLAVSAAPELETLRRAYASEMGGPDRDALAFTRNLLLRPQTIILGATVEREIVGFAVLIELPEAIFARSCGHLDDLYVTPVRRRQGIGGLLLGACGNVGRDRGWSHLRWLVPQGNAGALALYDGISETAPWRSFVVRIDPSFTL